MAPNMEQPAFALAWGVFIGGIIQLLFQLPFLYRAGVLVKPQWGWSDPHVVKVRTLMIPALFGVSVGQLNLLFDTFIASFLMTGSISWLYYSDRLLEFPLGLFGIAIATVILPALSRDHVGKQSQNFASNMDWGVRMVCLLGIPAATGLIVLAEPILLVIFARGAFTPEDATMASYSLTAYATGLLSFMLVKVLAPGFFSPPGYQNTGQVRHMVYGCQYAVQYCSCCSLWLCRISCCNQPFSNHECWTSLLHLTTTRRLSASGRDTTFYCKSGSGISCHGGSCVIRKTRHRYLVWDVFVVSNRSIVCTDCWCRSCLCHHDAFTWYQTAPLKGKNGRKLTNFNSLD